VGPAVYQPPPLGVCALLVHGAPVLRDAVHQHVRAGRAALSGEGVAAERDHHRLARACKRRRRRRWGCRRQRRRRGRRRERRRWRSRSEVRWVGRRRAADGDAARLPRPRAFAFAPVKKAPRAGCLGARRVQISRARQIRVVQSVVDPHPPKVVGVPVCARVGPQRQEVGATALLVHGAPVLRHVHPDVRAGRAGPNEEGVAAERDHHRLARACKRRYRRRRERRRWRSRSEVRWVGRRRAADGDAARLPHRRAFAPPPVESAPRARCLGAQRVQIPRARQIRAVQSVVGPHPPKVVGVPDRVGPQGQEVGATALLVHGALVPRDAVHPDVRAGRAALSDEGIAAEHDLDRLARARKWRRRRRWGCRRRRKRHGRRRRRRR